MARLSCCLLLALGSIANARLSESSSTSSDVPAQTETITLTCPPKGFDSVQNFDIDAFIKSRWHIQEQMAVSYLPATQNHCVYAEYKLADKKTFWGYDVKVHNYAEDVAPPHKAHDSSSLFGGGICAKIVDKSTGKLEVAPCFLPTFTSGAYWVIDWNDAEGWGLISGGPPTNIAPGGCRMGSGTNGSGLWIFTRQQKRDETVIAKVRAIAKAKGFDLSVLNAVDQSSCGSAGEADLVV